MERIVEGSFVAVYKTKLSKNHLCRSIGRQRIDDDLRIILVNGLAILRDLLFATHDAVIELDGVVTILDVKSPRVLVLRRGNMLAYLRLVVIERSPASHFFSLYLPYDCLLNIL